MKLFWSPRIFLWQAHATVSLHKTTVFEWKCLYPYNISLPDRYTSERPKLPRTKALTKHRRHGLNVLRTCLQTDYWYFIPQFPWWVLSIGRLTDWRQPSSSAHHKPELIANQSNKVQLISKPISNFSCSSCLHLLRGKRWGKGQHLRLASSTSHFLSLFLAESLLGKYIYIYMNIPAVSHFLLQHFSLIVHSRGK